MIDVHAKYTVVLKTLLDNKEAKEKIEKALSSYPIYTATSKNEYIPNIIPTRSELNEKILNYYKYREIGFETFGRFIDELEIAMKEIMPYYNQLFFTADQDFNIIYNVDYKRTIEKESTGEVKNIATSKSRNKGTSTDESTINSTNEQNGKGVKSDTPQDELSTSAESIDSVSYANEVNWSKGKETGKTTTGVNSSNASNSKNTANSNGTTKGKENTLETTKGNFGVVSAQDLIAKYREIIINIEQMIINDKRISELFMLVF